jgi:hypothetical protein
VGYADGDTLTFARTNKWKTAVLPWRGYTVQDSMTKVEYLQNRSTEAIVKLYDNVMKILKSDIDDQFGDETYVDGNASGNSKRIHGLESCLAESTTTNAAVAAASDTYAGLSTLLGNYGGSWTGTWPNGTGDAHYDFWTPILANTDSTDDTAFPTTTQTFAAQGDEVVRWAIIQCQKNKSKRGMLDLILFDRTFYMNFLELIDTKERFLSRPGRNEGSLAKLGFTDSVNFDGVDITHEYGVAASTGYGLNVDEMELRSMQSQLFVPTGHT